MIPKKYANIKKNARMLTSKINKTSNEYRRWINDGTTNRYILKSEQIPSGWSEGKTPQPLIRCQKCDKHLKKSKWTQQHFDTCEG